MEMLQNRAHYKIYMLIFVAFIAVPLWSQQKFTTTVHGKYFDLQPPGNEAVVFAKNIISTELYEHSAPAFSPDGKTVLWTIVEMNKPAHIMEMNMDGNTWSQPHRPSFADTMHDDFYPFFSPDGKYVLFSSRRYLPDGNSVKDMALWKVEIKENKWLTPHLFDSIVSTGIEYAHSISKKGNLFFSVRQVVEGKAQWKILYSKFINSSYTQPEPLDTIINDGSYVDGPFIAPDESFLIFESDRSGGEGSIDLYICFKNSNGKWSAPKNMGAKINSAAAERFAGLSPDGKYLFFGSNRNSELPDVYWIDASVINELK